MSFNPRTREGCDLFSNADRQGVRSFNPRTREGCDIGIKRKTISNHVSIHAPVKGATVVMGIVNAEEFVSIHAPVKGATSLKDQRSFLRNCFNPRTREGCDTTS